MYLKQQQTDLLNIFLGSEINMATAAIIGLIIVICLFAVRSYIKKLAHGCCGAGGDDEKKLVADSADLTDYKYKCTVTISGMTCKNCSARIENKFNRHDGIHASVNHKNGKAEIRALKPVEDLFIRQIVIGLGYGVISIERDN